MIASTFFGALRVLQAAHVWKSQGISRKRDVEIAIFVLLMMLVCLLMIIVCFVKDPPLWCVSALMTSLLHACLNVLSERLITRHYLLRSFESKVYRGRSQV